MKTSDFNYNLPKELIAQAPCDNRDKCKMLVLDRKSGKLIDKHFYDLETYIKPGDLFIINKTRVLPARLIGKKRNTGGKAEILLLKKDKTINEYEEIWQALVKPGKRLKPIQGNNKDIPIVDFYDECKNLLISAAILDWCDNAQAGMRSIKLYSNINLNVALHKIGKTPLPPYIHDYKGDMEMYQTVYSKTENSAAAPTAGLHFTNKLIDSLKNYGAIFKSINLEVGIDTFKPVTEKNPEDHKIHTELYSISKDTIEAINKTKANGNRVIAVGTTSVRSLESSYDLKKNKLVPCNRKPTSLFILPGYKFNVVDSMITNFHVPESTLMMLICAFAGYDNIMNSYNHAIMQKYRFLSFGDSMFII